MSNDRFRSTRMSSLDIGLNYGRKWELFDTDGEPLNLEQFDNGSIKVLIFDDQNATLDSFPCTVLTGAADKRDNSAGVPVADKMTFIAKPTGPSGNHFFHVVASISTEKFQLGQPAKIEINAAPPTT